MGKNEKDGSRKANRFKDKVYEKTEVDYLLEEGKEEQPLPKNDNDNDSEEEMKESKPMPKIIEIDEDNYDENAVYDKPMGFKVAVEGLENPQEQKEIIIISKEDKENLEAIKAERERLEFEKQLELKKKEKIIQENKAEFEKLKEK